MKTFRPAMLLMMIAVLAAVLGIVPAAAGSPGRYGEYDDGVYLPYVNAPGPGDDITMVPRLRRSNEPPM
jgi:hypothetical protein